MTRTSRTQPPPLTDEEYATILAFQGGGCAICHRKPKPGARRLNRDHDHRTGRLRGLVCFACNYRLLGRADDPELLRSAARYLERPPADEALLAL